MGVVGGGVDDGDGFLFSQVVPFIVLFVLVASVLGS